MATPAQILANRQNAQRSTGPKTAAGKNTASRNATRHGLTGSQMVIPGEDATAFEDLRQGLQQSYKPANEAESVLVDQIAANAWRLMRAQRVEAAFFAQLSEDTPNPETAIAIAFLERPDDIARIQRYVNAANSAYHKAQTQLAKLQKERAVAEEIKEEIQSDQPGIGFVSYNAPITNTTGAPASLSQGQAVAPIPQDRQHRIATRAA